MEGLRAVVLGRSDIVGSPVAAMLRNRDATVTQCHSKTKNLPDIVRLRLILSTRLLTIPQVKEADILVAAIGKPEFVQGSWLKPGVIVIDVGTNYITGTSIHTDTPSKTDRPPDPTKKSGQRLVGDVEFLSASQTASHITPVPGGVGPMTVAMLMHNTLKSAERLWEQTRAIKVTRLPLDIKEKVPSDIEIAMAQIPKDITMLAREIGLLPTEVENYGKYKAKVELSVLDRLNHRRDGKYIIISGSVALDPGVPLTAD